MTRILAILFLAAIAAALAWRLRSEEWPAEVEPEWPDEELGW